MPSSVPFFPECTRPIRLAHRIDEKNGAAVCDVNAERNAALVRHKTIATGEAFIVLEHAIDHGDFVAMNLLRGNERVSGEPIFRSCRAVNTLETAQCFRLILGDIDPGNAPDKTMD